MDVELKDLLTLAAKACGYDKTMRVVGLCDSTGNWAEYVKETLWKYGREVRVYWRPHLDDGDGARMETSAEISLERYKDRIVAHGMTSGVAVEYYSDHNGDRQAARRWASLRAAASIGRSMP